MAWQLSVSPLSFGVNFLFGGIATWVIACFYGTYPATLTALVTSLPTILLWGHPYAVIIFTLEALLVSEAWRRWQFNLVLIDGIYWLCLAAPLMGLIYAVTTQVAATQVIFLILKSSLNGIFNALIASLLMDYVPLQRWVSLPEPVSTRSLKQTFSNLLLAFALLPLLVLMFLQGQWAYPAPYVNSLQEIYIINLVIILVTGALALLLADILSRQLANPLAQLAQVTTNLPDKLLDCEEIVGSPSSITEINSLTHNFQQLAGVLRQKLTGVVEAETALRRSEEQLHLIADALPVLIAYVDSQQRYRFNNRAYEDWFGQPIPSC